jgi:hypothetical protein
LSEPSRKDDGRSGCVGVGWNPCRHCRTYPIGHKRMPRVCDLLYRPELAIIRAEKCRSVRDTARKSRWTSSADPLLSIVCDGQKYKVRIATNMANLDSQTILATALRRPAPCRDEVVAGDGARQSARPEWHLSRNGSVRMA